MLCMYNRTPRAIPTAEAGSKQTTDRFTVHSEVGGVVTPNIIVPPPDQLAPDDAARGTGPWFDSPQILYQ